MKILIILVLFLAGCGAINEQCGADARIACDVFLGEKVDVQEIDTRLKNTEKDLADLKTKIELLELKTESQALLLTLQSQELATMQNDSLALQTEIDSLVYDISVNELAFNNSLTSLANSVMSLNTTMQHAVTQIIDPCGDSAGFDEVVLKTTAGEYLAYFQSEGKRFLSKLTNGNYVTTDGTSCHFTVNGVNLTW